MDQKEIAPLTSAVDQMLRMRISPAAKYLIQLPFMELLRVSNRRMQVLLMSEACADPCDQAILPTTLA